MNEVLTKTLKEVIGKDPKSPYMFANPETGNPYTTIRTAFNKAVKRIRFKRIQFSRSKTYLVFQDVRTGSG